ncbi:aspartyl/glutamyl-tRNA amidotransferase subunit A [Thermoanaerobacterium thermosaccharolyticum]|jgi:aspartyl-tRNA(Asn)/glutamyl-tRNA(Gln) amidotransferase subunit A|uniref:Glutamyl-tRNA(Gln) amidotransferase subunit A n=2 Tax=Thermoanaerobacterium thermosaccharolyticum TaxID=1517 RepID=D9TQN1_THETC|nr:Asp-tRNA(Asn)/Glu-tRNA(Gln) amidotransferase subunit GatA [Thermoanaerobacterium thermosaccharolyticum]TCW42113.1 aspartyl/glutamyl-tRNA(Asn/Gln) amidotransferase subunit A [Thermohydrogenium kirishiense]ADL69567.1 glutamyl-tRNA(Gln) amidotransferase, A subunit [Thermoanaerobacterium thermosaccharolyticum DSM 571]AST56723.1 glutamyl-tRNA amidotransferase [Thermoanaerobacterium thermosaccharolyticum]MCP2239102.1 aspartyl-tRNA(Asn)/glutamyl-tRNA(Gln) amidotransferase subunit A [Thermoanaerobac
MELHKLKIHELHDLLKNKEVSAVDVTEAYLERIKEVEPQVDALICITEEYALKKAEEADKMIQDGNINDLTGIPVIIKDNMCTENIRTTCASKMLEDFVPPYNATVVEKLNNLGAVMVGKANLDEFAMGSSTENSAFKTTKNPWDLSRVPGGSSGGSAASVAADECAFSLGSDTGGSIRQPASLCGVVGMKPTYGLVSRYGLVAFASSLDQIGPLTKDVTDCAIVLNAIAGHDPKDSTSVDKMRKKDYKEFLKEDIKGMKIGYAKEFFRQGLDDGVRESIELALKIFEDLGAEVREISLPYLDYALAAYYIVSSAEASSNLARYDGIRYGHVATNYEDLIDMYMVSRSEGFGKEVKRRIMLGTYALSSGYYDAYYNKALKVRTLIKKDYEKAFEDVDVIVGPTSPTTAFKIGERVEDPLAMYLADVYTVPVNIAGLPGLSLPCGLSNDLPVGLQIVGKHFDEGVVLNAAYAFEKACNFNAKPSFKGGAR